MNNCLADLSKLIPAHYMKKGRGRVEKTEIIEMAIKHLKDLTETTNAHQQLQQQQLPTKFATNSSTTDANPSALANNSATGNIQTPQSPSSTGQPPAAFSPTNHSLLNQKMTTNAMMVLSSVSAVSSSTSTGALISPIGATTLPTTTVTTVNMNSNTSANYNSCMTNCSLAMQQNRVVVPKPEPFHQHQTDQNNQQPISNISSAPSADGLKHEQQVEMKSKSINVCNGNCNAPIHRGHHHHHHHHHHHNHHHHQHHNHHHTSSKSDKAHHRSSPTSSTNGSTSDSSSSSISSSCSRGSSGSSSSKSSNCSSSSSSLSSISSTSSNTSLTGTNEGGDNIRCTCASKRISGGGSSGSSSSLSSSYCSTGSNGNSNNSSQSTIAWYKKAWLVRSFSRSPQR